jgi:hypothetical protein
MATGSWWRRCIAGDALQKWSFGHSKLTSDEARLIAAAIARIDEFMMQRRSFYTRGQATTAGARRDRSMSPFADSYVRANRGDINAMCRFNGIPFDAAVEKSAGKVCGASISSPSNSTP